MHISATSSLKAQAATKESQRYDEDVARANATSRANQIVASRRLYWARSLRRLRRNNCVRNGECANDARGYILLNRVFEARARASRACN